MKEIKQTNVTFSELSLECKKALMEYCYMLGYTTFEELENFYQGRTFTFEVISVEEAKKRCMSHMADWSGYKGKSFEEYHANYIRNSTDIPDYGNSMYPVIEGGDEEWLHDGWHRFHSYIKNGATHIPVLCIE